MKRRVLNTALTALLLTSTIAPVTVNQVQADTIEDNTNNTDDNSQISASTAQSANQADNGTSALLPDTPSDPTVSPVAPSATPAMSSRMVTSFGTRGSQQAFIDQIAPYAQQSAGKYRLYASVMMAQAILESGWGTSALSMAPNYNLFGIKGSYNGAFVAMPTLEWVNGGYVTVTANFRRYPSYLESFNDNGNKLRNGVSWASDYYKGTWKENTSSYRDATAWLQGRYATDPTYASKLNNIIDTYNLTQYDNNTSSESSGVIDSSAYAYVVRITNVDHYSELYDNQGHLVEGPVLLKNTDWLSNSLKVVNGVQYYQVSTHLWVKAAEVTRVR